MPESLNHELDALKSSTLEQIRRFTKLKLPHYELDGMLECLERIRHHEHVTRKR